MVTQLPQQSRSTTEGRHDHPSGTHLDCATNLLQDQQRQCEQRVGTLEKLIDAKLVTLRTVVDAQAEKAVIALAAADKAVSKAEIATEKRFESVNEFRQTLSDQTQSFISRVEFDALRETNSARIADLSSRLDKTDGKSVGLNAGWVYLLGGLSALSLIVSLTIAIFR